MGGAERDEISRRRCKHWCMALRLEGDLTSSRLVGLVQMILIMCSRGFSANQITVMIVALRSEISTS